ncbi:hypothetical protein HA50_01950 [Pantoea cypripedii]|uniref:Uncharacterized protein n=1 Tax=Pantoea cypripedii TaxID=55209 RepID=A0A1X1EQD0_PANCY|nr:hypothetical protein HA50_01950 [Pantoea cypripedii]
MIRFHKVWRQRGFNTVLPDDLTVAKEVKFQRVSLNRINAGRQLFVCFHFVSSNLLVGIDMLPASSDQSGQTQWSVIVQAVSGSLLPAAVRLAPFTYVYVSVNSLKRKALSESGKVAKFISVAFRQGGAYV